MDKRTPKGPNGVVYLDLSQVPHRYEDRGVVLDDVRRKLHAVLPGGELVKGWPAVSAIWRRSPDLARLAKLGDLPVLRVFSGAAYSVAAQVLWWWNRASGRW